jgi:hypothetical protein
VRQPPLPLLVVVVVLLLLLVVMGSPYEESRRGRAGVDGGSE